MRLRVPLEEAVVATDCEMVAVLLSDRVEQALGEAEDDEKNDSEEHVVGEAEKDRRGDPEKVTDAEMLGDCRGEVVMLSVAEAQAVNKALGD